MDKKEVEELLYQALETEIDLRAEALDEAFEPPSPRANVDAVGRPQLETLYIADPQVH